MLIEQLLFENKYLAERVRQEKDEVSKLRKKVERLADLDNQCRMQQHRIRQLEAELTAPKELRVSVSGEQWIPCAERYPMKELREHMRQYDDDEVEVLVMVRGEDIATTLYFNGREFRDDVRAYEVDCWMPMPQPPLRAEELEDLFDGE